MLKLNLLDQVFAHQPSAVPDKKPRLVDWDRTCSTAAPRILTDWSFGHVQPNLPGQFGWLLESPLANAGRFARSRLSYVESHLEAIFTSERERVRVNPEKYRYASVGGIWIQDPGIRPKTKRASIIASQKAFTREQAMRSALADELTGVEGVDVFGRGRVRLDRVEEALDDYMFSYAIENVQSEGYWTEKILNCFATGTVPVYLGAPDIGRYFDERGIVLIDSSDEALDLTPKHYEALRPYVVANFHEALRYEIPDDKLISDHFSEWL